MFGRIMYFAFQLNKSAKEFRWFRKSKKGKDSFFEGP
jgi:hypothetical protein